MEKGFIISNEFYNKAQREVNPDYELGKYLSDVQYKVNRHETVQVLGMDIMKFLGIKRLI